MFWMLAGHMSHIVALQPLWAISFPVAQHVPKLPHWKCPDNPVGSGSPTSFAGQEAHVPPWTESLAACERTSDFSDDRACPDWWLRLKNRWENITNTKRKARLNAEHDHLQVAFGNIPYRHSRKIRQTQMGNCGTSLGYQGTHLLVTERHIAICCLHWWTPHICWLIFTFVWLMPFLFVDWLNHESTSMLDTPNASWCTSPGSYKCPPVSWHNSHLPCVDDLN